MGLMGYASLSDQPSSTLPNFTKVCSHFARGLAAFIVAVDNKVSVFI